jgi:hypothetical protein
MLNACPTRAREDGCKQNMLGKKKKGARKSVCTMWIASPTRARKMDANRPASVPVTLTAPSVPRGTIDRVVTKYVVLPKALPISLEIVSLSLVQKLARKPSCHRNWHSGPPTPAIVATAHTVPAMPDPHTLEGPRLPPLFSAVSSSCFVLIFTLVAPVP